jgi:hypothetical protein
MVSALDYCVFDTSLPGCVVVYQYEVAGSLDQDQFLFGYPPELFAPETRQVDPTFSAKATTRVIACGGSNAKVISAFSRRTELPDGLEDDPDLGGGASDGSSCQWDYMPLRTGSERVSPDFSPGGGRTL